MRVGIISCGKEKLNHPAKAEDLYTSSYFRLCKRWIKPRVNKWIILSAKHGVVQPRQILAPYDLKLGDLSKKQKEQWKQKVKQQLIELYGKETIYMILAGADYRSALYGFPCVEDVISRWKEKRRQQGLSGRKAYMGIGNIKKALANNESYY